MNLMRHEIISRRMILHGSTRGSSPAFTEEVKLLCKKQGRLYLSCDIFNTFEERTRDVKHRN